MKYIAIFCALITLVIGSAEASDINKKKMSHKAQGSSWIPTPFALVNGKLPAKYSGIDGKKFYNLFKSKADSIKKDEFETTAEFEARIGDANSILKPINTSELYAFEAFIWIEYDADANQYQVRDPASCVHIPDRLPSCKIEEIYSKSSKYVGTNSYGASAIITKIDQADFHLFFSPHSTMDSYINPRTQSFSDKFEYPIEKARNLNTSEIKFLLVGKVISAKLISEINPANTPTIDKPYSVSSTDTGVEFEIKKIIYYYQPTGEILMERNLDSI